jgi:radical SAM superfamily enzyme YgiQ (UPF0313 family)
MKILLLYVPPPHALYEKSNRAQVASVFPPLGFLYLGSILEKNGHTVEIIDTLLEEKPVERLKKSLISADVVGITVYTITCEKIRQWTKIIKEFDSEIPIIIGGPHCMYNSDRALRDIPDADLCIDGEGEPIIDDVLKELEGSKDFSKLPGLHYRKNNEIKNGKTPLVIQNLDSIPFPARHLLDKYDYEEAIGSYWFRPKFTTMLTSRGCPFKCKFCTRNVTSMEFFRKRSAENVIKEISYSAIQIDGFLFFSFFSLSL